MCWSEEGDRKVPQRKFGFLGNIKEILERQWIRKIRYVMM